MSEKLSVCQALASMIRSHGEPSEEEVIFVANAAMELGLEVEDNRKVREVFEEGGDYEAFISGISDRELRLYLFRRVVAATLIDEQINEAELAFIDKSLAFHLNKISFRGFMLKDIITLKCTHQSFIRAQNQRLIIITDDGEFAAIDLDDFDHPATR